MHSGSANVLNNRLIFSGGTSGSAPRNEIFVYNEETGWHLSNLELNKQRSGHFSLEIDAAFLAQNYVEPPNIWASFGIDPSGSSTSSEVICMSQNLKSQFSEKCHSPDSLLSNMAASFGAVLLFHRGNLIYCGGSHMGEIRRYQSILR